VHFSVMDCVKNIMVLFLVMASVHVSMATVYKVGDASGWSTQGTVDYKKWAAEKTFKIGDVIVFEYNNQFHDVLEMSHNDYDTCNTKAALKTYKSGNDSITISRYGHFYYLCGYPGHCEGGQKVDIRVVNSSKAPSPTSSPRPAAAPASHHHHSGSDAPSPSPAPLPSSPPKKSGASVSSKGVLGAAFGLAVLAIAH
ncbi:hypothetical protein IFM89_002690, partial [Coptis chinensis]